MEMMLKMQLRFQANELVLWNSNSLLVLRYDATCKVIFYFSHNFLSSESAQWGHNRECLPTLSVHYLNTNYSLSFRKHMCLLLQYLHSLLYTKPVKLRITLKRLEWLSDKSTRLCRALEFVSQHIYGGSRSPGSPFTGNL